MLVQLRKDFPAYFYSNENMDKFHSRKIKDKASDMQLWNLLMDMNLVSQAPINFTEG